MDVTIQRLEETDWMPSIIDANSTSSRFMKWYDHAINQEITNQT